jgi:hypothetical protein
MLLLSPALLAPVEDAPAAEEESTALAELLSCADEESTPEDGATDDEDGANDEDAVPPDEELVFPPPQPTWQVPKSAPARNCVARPVSVQHPWPTSQSASRPHTRTGGTMAMGSIQSAAGLQLVPRVSAQHTSSLRQSSGPSHASESPKPLHMLASHVGAPPSGMQHRLVEDGSHTALWHTTPVSCAPM